MGSPKSDKSAAANEIPQHPVKILPLWVAETELTWEQYDVYLKNNQGNTLRQIQAEKDKASQDRIDAISGPSYFLYADETFDYGGENMAALNMTHHAAMDYCRWLSQQTRQVYRLPTEAEWEWACRAGSTTTYSFGDDPGKLGEYAWFAGNSADAPHKVRTKKPNPWGLYDMHGNLAEWCLDSYDSRYYSTLPLDRAMLEPVLLPKEDPEPRFPHVVRGGSWVDKAGTLRSAARKWSEKRWARQDPMIPKSLWWLTDADFVGFRIVRAVEEPVNLKGVRSKMRWMSK